MTKPIIVLHRPQKIINIGGVVRAMKNMGLRELRLVAPAEFDEGDILGIAHRCEDILAGARRYATLDAALADVAYVVGTSARRRAGPPPATPRAIAPELLARCADGPVALLFGPEDNGLGAAELDRCHQLVAIPTDPGYASLNLAQAVLVLAYELHLAEPAPPPAEPRGYPPADGAQREALFGELERALGAIEFLKGERAASVMRSLRALIHRADPDVREAALLTAICREVGHFARRRG